MQVNLFAEKLLISLSLFIGETLLAETLGTDENPHVYEVILLLLYVLFALHDRLLQELTLVPLVTVEGRHTRTYLFDLHTVRKFAAADINFVITD